MKRIDQILVDRQMITTRSRAQDMIERQLIQVNGKVIEKASVKFDETTGLKIEILVEDSDVGRGAKKIRPIAVHYQEKIKEQYCLDVGASTGGFTQVLLELGAKHVTALDVGTGQLHSSLLNDSRVLSLEGMHIQDFPAYFQEHEMDAISVVTVDVSFISLSKVIPFLWPVLGKNGFFIFLFKPQFEVGRNLLKKGIAQLTLKEAQKHIDRFVTTVIEMAGTHGHSCRLVQSEPCQLKGRHGNQEFIIVLESLCL
jgi:23S rRNA (cytidine1920-2'-O)/16S rRNA (cytidine1409-2'-O)-methyltransferase